MREAGLSATIRRCAPRTTDSRHDHPVAPNLLERRFATARPDAVWLADMVQIEALIAQAERDLTRHNAARTGKAKTEDGSVALAGCR